MRERESRSTTTRHPPTPSSEHQKFEVPKSSPNHLGLDVLDGSCPIDGAEGDIDGDAESELALDDGHPGLDDQGPAAHELCLAEGLQELLQSLLEVLALVSVSVWVILNRIGRGKSE